MEKYQELLGKNGFFIFDIKNLELLKLFKSEVEKSFNTKNLSSIHKYTNFESINKKRINAFRSLNKIEDWENKYYSLANFFLQNLLGPDIAIQSKLNLSIQMPDDSSSVLDLHTDSLSGQSIFELVTWIPLTDAFDSNAMYIFNLENSQKMLKEMPEHEDHGMVYLFDKYKKKAEFINIKYGQGLIFSPTLFHGNITNKTKYTRVSINCRFKNIFSHENSTGERRLGSFYRILKISPLTKIALSYRDDLVSFL